MQRGPREMGDTRLSEAIRMYFLGMARSYAIFDVADLIVPALFFRDPTYRSKFTFVT